MADLESTNERAASDTQCEAEDLSSDCHTTECDQSPSVAMDTASRMTPILEVKLATKDKEVGALAIERGRGLVADHHRIVT